MGIIDNIDNHRAASKFIGVCWKEQMMPDRQVVAEDGSIILSWVRPGKYAEVEFNNIRVAAWTCYEIEDPTMILDIRADSPDVDSQLISALDNIEEFLA